MSFVSLGPGDPELITIKALNTLKDADVVIVPATARTMEGSAVQGQLNATSSRAAEIIRYWDIQAMVRMFAVPMSRDGQLAQRAYDDICVEIAQFYRDHLRVAVAVEGDVSIYASIHYVMDRLQTMGIPVEQLPGITSFIAAAAESRLSLISHQESLHVIPGTAREAEMDRLLASECSLVIMKLSQCEEEVTSFMASHQNYEYHYFENVGAAGSFYANQVDAISRRRFPYFSLMIIKGGGR